MGLVQWVIIIVLVAIILFGFAAVFDFGKGVLRNVYPSDALGQIQTDNGILYDKVSEVIDGDTIVLKSSGQHIRLAVVNTPEQNEYNYLAAKTWTEYRCLNKKVIVDLDDGQTKGTYDRLIGAVYCGKDDRYVNKELIYMGLGVPLPSACKVSEFKEELCFGGGGQETINSPINNFTTTW